jgi:tetratricopeptide (TPR) repeat protein
VEFIERGMKRLIFISFVITSVMGQITKRPRPQPDPLKLQGIEKCCEFIDDPVALMQCANSSSYVNMKRVVDSIDGFGGPTLGVGIVTYATEDIWNYTAYSLAVNEAYAEHNGYIMLHLDPATAKFDEFDARWNKIKILEEALHPERGWARNLDYVMWVDADLIFLDLGLRLEQVAAANPKADVIISAEHAGSSTLVNSGTVMVRNSRWGRQFLADWWDFGARKLFSDQEQFDLLYESRRAEMQQHIAILPPDALNSDPPAMTKQKPHNQVLHLMGEHTHYRMKAFGSAFKEICRKVSDVEKKIKPSAPLALQLTNTVDNLHLWTIESYYDEMAERMKNYKLLMKEGLNDIKKSRLLANAVHHYAHAVEHRGSPGDEELATSLRNETFLVLLENLNNRRKLNKENIEKKGNVMPDWPESMKCVCEAGQHMVGRGTSEQKKAVGKLVMDLLYELVNFCHHLQRPAVMHMIAALYMDIGLIDYYDQKIPDALVNLEKSLQLTSKLAESSGNHILVSPMTILANSYAQLEDYDKAFSFYQQSIEITERHLGVDHESLGEILLNFGTAKYLFGSQREARKLLGRCLEIYAKNGYPETHYAYQRAVRLYHSIMPTDL